MNYILKWPLKLSGGWKITDPTGLKHRRNKARLGGLISTHSRDPVSGKSSARKNPDLWGLVSTKPMTQKKIQFPPRRVSALLHGAETHFFKTRVRCRKVETAHNASQQSRAMKRNKNNEGRISLHQGPDRTGLRWHQLHLAYQTRLSMPTTDNTEESLSSDSVGTLLLWGWTSVTIGWSGLMCFV